MSHTTLTARVQGVVGRCPSAPAVTGDGISLGYAELWDRVLGLAADFRAWDMPQGTIAALDVRDPAYFPVAFLATRLSGLVPLMLDRLLPVRRRAAMVEAARPSLLVRVSDEPVICMASRDPVRLPTEAGYVTFSSGSQGPVPKGIIGQEAGVVHFLDWEIGTLETATGARVAQLTSPSFDVALREMLLPLLTGGELRIPPAEVRNDPAAVLPWLADNGIEVVHLVPSLSTRWLAASSVTLPRLRWALFAGEPLYAEQVRAWRRIAPYARVVNLYGPSETTLAKFWHEVSPDPQPGLQPVGRPLPGTSLGREPIGAGSFRISIRTPYGALRYLPGTVSETDDARLTRSEGVTRFVTQDRGRLDRRGRLLVEGRLDSLVKRRGVFVDVARMAEVAMSVAGVSSACAAQIDLGSSGDVVLAVAGEMSLPDLRRALRRSLGTEVPDDIVVVERLPLLPNGKLDRQQVGRLALTGRSGS